MNNATFAGNIGQDCRVNTVNGNQGQITVVNFSLAVDKKKKDQNGNKETLWVDCAVWGKQAEVLQQYLVKGQNVSVSGSVDVDTFTKNDGQIIPKLNLMVRDLTLQGSASQPQNGNYQQPQQPQPNQQQIPQGQPQQQMQQQHQGQSYDDDIPFAPIGLQYRGILNAM
jgi:single-strand DNA-binding protein